MGGDGRREEANGSPVEHRDCDGTAVSKPGGGRRLGAPSKPGGGPLERPRCSCAVGTTEVTSGPDVD